jgi:hypothetical protein
MDRLPCPDGYFIESQDPHRYAHEQINLWLVEQEEWDGKHPHQPQIMDHKALKKQFKTPQLIEFLEAAMVRSDWHQAQGNAGPGNPHSVRIHYILVSLSRLPLALHAEQMRLVIDFAARRGPYQFCDHIEDAFQRGLLDADLWSRLHALPQAMSGDNSVGGQAIRRRIGVLLWHDPYDEIDLKRCWSEAVRRDLRAMPEERRKMWRSALEATPISDSTEPPSAWNKQAPKQVAAIGEAAFREQLLAWFAPFQGDEPVRLTMAGSHILKALLWYARLIRHARLDAAVFALLDTKWKNKQFKFRPLTVLAGSAALLPPVEAYPILVRIHAIMGGNLSARFEKVIKEIGEKIGRTPDDLLAEGLLKPPPNTQPVDVSAILKKLEKMNTMYPNAPPPSRFHYYGDYIEIEGLRDRYRAHTPSCTVRRLRDQALVELDHARVPSHWRPLLLGADATEFYKFAQLLFLLSMDERFDFITFRLT